MFIQYIYTIYVVINYFAIRHEFARVRVHTNVQCRNRGHYNVHLKPSA